VLDEDVARLSPFASRHLGVHGTCSFVLPDLAPAPSANCAIPAPATTMTNDGAAATGNPARPSATGAPLTVAATCIRQTCLF
jgi:hypothetical protein